MKQNYSLPHFIQDIWQFVKPYKLSFFGATFLRASSDLTQLYGAWVLSEIISRFSQNIPLTLNSFLSEFWWMLVLWLIADQYNAIGRGLAKMIGFKVAEQAAIAAMKKTLTHLFSLDLEWQESRHSGDKLKRINRGRDAIKEVLRDYFNMMIEIVVVIAVNVTVFTTLDSSIGIALAVFMVSFYLLSLYMTQKASHQEHVVNKAEEVLESINYESLSNIKTIKSLAISPAMTTQIGVASERVIEGIKKRIFLFQGRALFLNIYFYVFRFAIIFYLLWQIIQGNFELGIIVLFMSYFDKLGSAIWELADVTQRTIIFKIWTERMMSILSTPSTIEKAPGVQLPYPSDWKKLNLDQLKFYYKDTNALRNITASIRRGESIGIVGLSGAGKSTLFKLLMDLHENYSGSLNFDGRELKDIERDSYIQHVAVVLQDTELFNISLQDNIFIARRSGQSEDANQLQKVIKMAHLDELVSRLPAGLHTIVGEKGVTLSGGERQRLGIARALYRQPDILLLDEATSHLDVYSEKHIQKALDSFFKKVTAIVIAHRLTTVKKMDRILVLDKGVIAESGTFDELMKRDGMFARMWREQKL